MEPQNKLLNLMINYTCNSSRSPWKILILQLAVLLFHFSPDLSQKQAHLLQQCPHVDFYQNKCDQPNFGSGFDAGKSLLSKIQIHDFNSFNQSDVSRNREKITVSQYLELAFWSLCSVAACSVQAVQIPVARGDDPALIRGSMSLIYTDADRASQLTYGHGFQRPLRLAKCGGMRRATCNIQWTNFNSLTLAVTLQTDSERQAKKFALWLMRISTSFQVLPAYGQKQRYGVKLSNYFLFSIAWALPRQNTYLAITPLKSIGWVTKLLASQRIQEYSSLNSN